MYSKADIVTLFVSPKNLRYKRFSKYICQNQDWRIPILMVYMMWNHQMSNKRVLWRIFVMKIPDNPLNPDGFVRHLRYRALITHLLSIERADWSK